MRGCVLGLQVRAVTAVDGREQRILAARRQPSLAHARERQRHPVIGLMARHAAAAVRAERHEEGMTARVDRTRGIQDPERAGRVRVQRLGG